ncbi:MAG TPA: PhzF family phenazine biosynthesis protein [Candidatus Bathyarchaeia archaeon]|nr:PhzF family phenazine biosynthesis protein [Candidatus Bathyarchaeia archaeon]
MAKLVFYVIDVFAEKKFAGNQLAVYRSAGMLSGEEMQKIAKEMHFSETIFILSEKQKDGGYDVRIFSPEKEMPFAGHPTLGTAFVIQQEIIKQKVDEVGLNLKVGQIPVSFNYKDNRPDTLFMKQVPPTFGRTVDPKTVSEVLGIDVDDIDSRFPVEEVSTGLPFLIVPLKTLDAVKRARTNRDEYLKLIEGLDAKAILLFCPETYSEDNDLNARMFGDYFGIAEDPASGSANGCLAGYLVKHRFFGKDRIDLRVEQGYEIGRPSLLLLKAENKPKWKVLVGGRALMVAKGELV